MNLQAKTSPLAWAWYHNTLAFACKAQNDCAISHQGLVIFPWAYIFHLSAWLGLYSSWPGNPEQSEQAVDSQHSCKIWQWNVWQPPLAPHTHGESTSLPPALQVPAAQVCFCIRLSALHWVFQSAFPPANLHVSCGFSTREPNDPRNYVLESELSPL